MLAPKGQALVRVIFEDREGNEGSTQMYLPFSAPAAHWEAWAAVYLPLLQDLSDARIVRYIVTHSYTETEALAAGSNSDISRNLVLYYSSGVDFDALYFPSGKLDLLESVGDYAGVRLDAFRPDVVDLLALASEVVTYIVTPEGLPFPITFVVGGLAL